MTSLARCASPMMRSSAARASPMSGVARASQRSAALALAAIAASGCLISCEIDAESSPAAARRLSWAIWVSWARAARSARRVRRFCTTSATIAAACSASATATSRIGPPRCCNRPGSPGAAAAGTSPASTSKPPFSERAPNITTFER